MPMPISKAATNDTMLKTGRLYGHLYTHPDATIGMTMTQMSALYLQTKNQGHQSVGILQVMIAACDTFRSGAVEQLKTHCNRLRVPLYERGYEKDPAKVAYEAAQQAARSKIDVLLVDTAGAQLSTQMQTRSSLILLKGFSTPQVAHWSAHGLQSLSTALTTGWLGQQYCNSMTKKTATVLSI